MSEMEDEQPVLDDVDGTRIQDKSCELCVQEKLWVPCLRQTQWTHRNGSISQVRMMMKTVKTLRSLHPCTHSQVLHRGKHATQRLHVWLP